MMRAGKPALPVVIMVALSLILSLNPSLGEVETADAEHVHIDGSAFAPDSLIVRPGDEVTWHNHDGFVHTATADNGDWDTGMLDGGQSHSLTFDDSGAWSYHCAFHPSMTATLIVNLLPTVTIDAPGDGSSVNGTVILEGSASDPDGNVEKVELRINGGDWETTSGTTSWSHEWDTQKESNGDHVVDVRSFDGIEHSAIETITLTVDNGAFVDLEIRPQDIDAMMNPIESQIDVTVSNHGNQPAPAFLLVLEYTYNDVVHKIAEIEVADLAGFSAQTHRFTWDTVGKLGDFEITASADRDGQSGDIDPTNNEATVTVSVLVEGMEGIDLLPGV